MVTLTYRCAHACTACGTRLLAVLTGAIAWFAIVPETSAAAVAVDGIGTPRIRRVYQATRILGDSPLIDGRLGDACWTGPGEWSGHYTQQEPDEGVPPSQPTEMKILYDDRYLYVGIRAFDTELANVPHLRGKRDEFTGDMVGITFDSYHDLRTAFEFNVTSGGSKIDLQIRDREIDLSWNAVWDVRVALEPDAWTAEYRIPFSQLRYAPAEQQIWGLHSWRWIKRRQEESDWNPIPQDNSGLVFEFGELHGIDRLPAARRIELLPYVVAQYATAQREPGNPYRTGSRREFEFGLDAKVGLSSDFTLDLTLNPDFGQVEADPSEINLTTFETFLEERRPFFVEGKDVLEWPLGVEDQLFYSRRIGQAPRLSPAGVAGFVDVPTITRIDGAAKITGKTRRGLAAGALYARTAEEHARIFENGGERTVIAEPATQFFVTRAQQEIAGGRTIVGGLATATMRSIPAGDPAGDIVPERAFTGGFDFLHRWNDRNYELAAQVTGSRVTGTPAAIQALMESPVHNFQRSDADHVAVRTDSGSLDGHGGRIRLGRTGGGRWRYSSSYGWRSPGLDLNDLGFLTEADRHRFIAGVDYVVTTPGRWVRNYEGHLAHYEFYDFGGTHLNRRTEFAGEVRLKSDWRFEPWMLHTGTDRDTHLLRGGPSFLRPARWDGGLKIESPGTETWAWSIEGEHGIAESGRTRGTAIELELTWRALGLLTIEPEISYETVRDDLQYVATSVAAPSNTPRYILGRMEQRTLSTTVRVDVNFSPTLSLSWYGSLFASSGDFTRFKRVTNPLAARYGDRFARLEGLATAAPGGGDFTVNDGAETYTFANPDFDLRELQSNLVLRWEYQAGSSVFVVWTQDRAATDFFRGFSASRDYRRLLSAHPNNTFLVKVSYWFAP